MKILYLIIPSLFFFACKPKYTKNYSSYSGYAIVFIEKNYSNNSLFLFTVSKEEMLKKDVEKIISSRNSVQIPVIKKNRLLNERVCYYSNSNNYCSLPPQSICYYKYIYISYSNFEGVEDNKYEINQRCSMAYEYGKNSIVDTLYLIE